MGSRIVLIRHGESRAQVDGIVAGHDTCTGLSAGGADQVARLRHRLLATGEVADADGVYSSVLPRAVETANAVLDATAAPSLIQACSWCELHPGEAEGMTWAGMRDRFPPKGDADDPYRRRLPKMETWTEMFKRVAIALTSLEGRHRGTTALVVGHGGTIAASFVAFGHARVRQGVGLARATTNASITEWRSTAAGWQLMRFNDAAHLHPGAFPNPGGFNESPAS